MLRIFKKLEDLGWVLAHRQIIFRNPMVAQQQNALCNGVAAQQQTATGTGKQEGEGPCRWGQKAEVSTGEKNDKAGVVLDGRSFRRSAEKLHEGASTVIERASEQESFKKWPSADLK